MRYCRFHHNGSDHYGLVESVAGADFITRTFLQPPATSDGDVEGLPSRRIDRIPFADAALLAPVEPSKIVCIGRNYREHAAELGHDLPTEPLIFLKAPTALLVPGGTILRPKISARTDYEGELGVVIGRRCRHLRDDEDVRPYILGYTCVNDFTARDLQNKDGQWTRAKGFDTFCPVGPLVCDAGDGSQAGNNENGGIDRATNKGLDPWAGIQVETRVNGEIRQSGNTRDFIFTLDVVLRFITQVMTLHPGDLIATGTPSGVAPVVAGDVVEIAIPGIGVLRNPVADES
ncbi:MAG: fumarylacetoacetate hydrolase family protein [Terriglobales bacterium]